MFRGFVHLVDSIHAFGSICKARRVESSEAGNILFSMLVVQFECDAFFGSKCLILWLIWNGSDSANVSCNARQDLLRKKAP